MMFFFSSRRRHTRSKRDWSSDVCSSDLMTANSCISTCRSAYSGREALRHLLSQEFAVILLDVNMPGMDGFETAQLIRQREATRDLPIIFVTAYGDETHIARSYSLGAVDYIHTPVVPEVLRSKVAVFVDLFKKTLQVKRQADSL